MNHLAVHCRALGDVTPPFEAFSDMMISPRELLYVSSDVQAPAQLVESLLIVERRDLTG